MNNTKLFCRDVIRKYEYLMCALGSGKLAAYEVDFSNFAKEVHEENDFTYRYYMDVLRSFTLNLKFTASCILEDASNEVSYWNNVQHQLELRSTEVVMALKLCYLAAELEIPSLTTLDRCQKIWEAHVIELAILQASTPRVRSNVQAQFYLRSADPLHCAKARVFLAKNDNSRIAIRAAA